VASPVNIDGGAEVVLLERELVGTASTPDLLDEDDVVVTAGGGGKGAGEVVVGVTVGGGGGGGADWELTSCAGAGGGSLGALQYEINC
jgi:hypothetical protein